MKKPTAPTTVIASEIAAELACKAAFKRHPKAQYAWCCHHQILLEPLVCPPMDRIDYILHHKHFYEYIERFNNFRPVSLRSLRELKKHHPKIWERLNDGYVFRGTGTGRTERSILKLYRKDVPWGTWNRGICK